MSEMKIPKSRIAVLVGIKGKTRREIEKSTKTKIKIDSKEGDVEISGEDSLDVYKTEEIVKAIGRGFNPKIALKLLNEDYIFELFDLNQELGKKKSKHSRIKSRLIGSEGKCRKTIESLCDVKICIYGKTVGIIGNVECVHIARQGIQDILRGALHGPTYQKLEEKMHELRE